ncbi:MAG TPA: tetratricopeptide repeat protein, partial [Polyangia bacterium]|nr:tetratricopeptide repeat protein [Polyangia bacterium]
AGRCLVPMDETDLFFNLRLGEIVLTTHAVPRTNLLSFTAPGAPDVNLAWIFQIVLALAYRIAGIPGTVVLKTTFVVATFGALFRVALRRGAHPAVTAAALALAAWAAEPRFVERPHLVTFLGLALTLLALERAEAGRPRALWALVPAGLVWANANSCFFLAPAVLLLYAGGARLDGRPNDARRAALVALALLPLTFATPSGAGVLRYVANHLRMPSLRPLQEYRSAGWPVDGPFFFLIAAACVGVAARPRAWRQLLPILALAILGARRIRFVAEFSLLAGPYVAATFTRLAARVTVGARAAASFVVGATLVGLTIIPRLSAARDGEPILSLGVEPDLVPRAAIAFANENGLRDHMYNDLEVGSYLTWEGWPRRRVFQDPRINGYPDAMHAVLRRADLTRAEWQSFLDGFGVTSALISYPAQNPRAALFDPALWALVYRASDGLVFARRTADHADVIRRAELPIEITPAGDAIAERVLEARPPSSSVADCVWWGRVAEAFVERHEDGRARPYYERALGDRSSWCDGAARDAWADALGDLALRLDDREAAVAAYGRSSAPGARVKRGFALLALQRPAEALVELQTARDDPDALLGAGLALEALDRRDEARAALEAFVRLAPNHVGTTRARAELARLR